MPTPRWYTDIIVEQLTLTFSLDNDRHIVPQVDRFLNGADHRDTRNKIIEALYDAIYGDEFLKLKTLQAIGPGKDVHKFLADLIARPPTITIVIEEYTNQLREALRKYTQKNVVEFRTFRRVGAEAVHAHLFEPIFQRRTDSPGNHRVIISEFTGKVTAQSAVADTLKDSMKTVKEIAEITGLKENNIRTSLSRLKGMGKATKIGDKWGLRTYHQDDMPF